MIWGFSQSLNIPIDDVLDEWSFENLLLFSRATPSYESESKEEREERERQEQFDKFDANVVGKFDADIIEE